jgi:Fe-S-cluster containining protein
MKPTAENIETLATEKGIENWDFRSFLKFYDKLSDDKLDKLVADITRRVWAEIDCTACANCCKTLHPEFSDKDQQIVAEKLGISVEQFREKYLELNTDDDESVWQIRQSPCPFLENNKCTIYENRPTDCRDYPYLYEPEFSSRTMGMVERTYTCPIVFEVFEELKAHLCFRPKKSQ